MLPVSRLTSHVLIPSRADTHFSTREEQAEQVMPVTANFSFLIIVLYPLLHQFFQCITEFIHDFIIAVTDIIRNTGFNMLGEQRFVESV